MLRITDSLLGPPRVSEAILGGVIARLDGPDQKDREFLNRLVHWCAVAGVDDANAISQALWETDNLRAIRWTRDTNPAGIGIVGDATAQPFTIATADEAARLFVQCLYSMVKKAWHPGVPIPPKAQSWMDGVWLAKVRNPAYPKGVSQVQDENLIYYTPDGDWHAVWGADPNYLQHVQRGNQFMPALPDQGSATPPKETPPMSIPYNAPPVEIAITPYNNANRPKLYMDPEYETVHEVGNTAPGANEDMHKLFVHNGGGPAQVSFHFVVGPTKAIQLIPLDEAAWHASDGYNGTGNRKSVAIETIQIGDFNKTLWHLAWLLNELEVNPGRFYANERRSDWKFSINRIKQHHDWAPDGKDCPEFIRDRGLWPTLMERVDAWHAAGQPEPAPEPEPVPEPEPDTKHELPAGISPELARRLFGRYIAPWDRTEYSFDITQAPSQVWVARGKKTGQWPSLNVVVRRGNGNEFWVWSNGDTYERKLSTQRGAA